MWAFEAYADGLSVTAPGAESKTTSAPPQELHKTSRNNDLFDASGKPLAPDAVHDVTTWRTHHAFGGRCALVHQTPQSVHEDSASNAAAATHAPAYPSGPSWAEQAWTAYQNWSIAFHLHSVTAEEPHILLSVAPAYFPMLSSPTGETLVPDAATQDSLPAAPSAEEQQHYNNRLLDTPLIWEEAYALSVECTPRGMFLWSNHWELFGKKISDRCLEVEKHSAVEAPLQSYNAGVRLRFNSTSAAALATNAEATTTVASTPVLAVDLRAPASLPQPLAVAISKEGDEALWQHVMDIPLPMDAIAHKSAFRPHVTLLESGDSVHII